VKYRLRTLLIVLALGPPLLAGGWWQYANWQARSSYRAIRSMDPADLKPDLHWSPPNEGDPSGRAP